MPSVRTYCGGFVFGFRDLVDLVGLMPLGALYPSKSGLMNKHIVKHIVSAGTIVCLFVCLFVGSFVVGLGTD